MLSFNVKCAIQVLAELEKAKAAGRRVSITELKASCGLDGQSVPAVITRLRTKYWLESSGNRYYLTIDLSRATLYDLVLAIDNTIIMGREVAVEGWPLCNREKFAEAIELDDRLRFGMGCRLKAVLLAELFTCHKSTGHKLPVRVLRRAAGTKIADGNVVFENRY